LHRELVGIRKKKIEQKLRHVQDNPAAYGQKMVTFLVSKYEGHGDVTVGNKWRNDRQGKEPKRKVTKKGDCWIVGPHCGKTQRFQGGRTEKQRLAELTRRLMTEKKNFEAGGQNLSHIHRKV